LESAGIWQWAAAAVEEEAAEEEVVMMSRLGFCGGGGWRRVRMRAATLNKIPVHAPTLAV
jgi:hypothetical protein